MKNFLLLLIISTALLNAQESLDKLLYLSSNKVGISANYQSLKIGDETLSQLSIPLNIVVPVSNRTTLSINGNAAMSKYAENDLNGLGETKIGLRFILPGERLMLRALVGVPTGKTKLDNTQFYISQLLSMNPFEYPISYYGQGLNANLSAVYAFPVSRSFVIGAGAAYNYRGDFYPKKTESGGKFDPGDEIIADLGFDVKLSDQLGFNFDVAYTLYSRDKYDDQEIFELGDKISIYGELRFNISRLKNSIFVINRIKSNNMALSDISEDDLKTGAQFDVGYRGRLPVTYLTALLFKAGFKLYQDSEYISGGELIKTGKTTLIGVGAGISLNVSDYTSFEVLGEYKTGKMNLLLIKDEQDISGFSASFGTVIRF